MKTGTGVQAILKFCLKILKAVILVLLLGGIYELRRRDGLKCHDTHTKFNKDWFRNSKVVEEYTHTDTQTGR
jgi:hypothetical protein